MSWEQRNADFCKAQTDAQLTYIEAERRAAELEEQNAKLRGLVRTMWLYDYAGKFSSAQEDVEHVAMVYRCMRELGVEI